MVRHIILWKIKEEVKDPEAAKAAMKRELEALMGKIDGLLEMEVITRPLPSCNADVMLKSAFHSQTRRRLRIISSTRNTNGWGKPLFAPW